MRSEQEIQKALDEICRTFDEMEFGHTAKQALLDQINILRWVLKQPPVNLINNGFKARK